MMEIFFKTSLHPIRNTIVPVLSELKLFEPLKLGRVLLVSRCVYGETSSLTCSNKTNTFLIFHCILKKLPMLFWWRLFRTRSSAARVVFCCSSLTTRFSNAAIYAFLRRR